MADFTKSEQDALNVISAAFNHNKTLSRNIGTAQASSRKAQQDHISKTRELEQQLKEAKDAKEDAEGKLKMVLTSKASEVGQREMALRAKLDAAEQEISNLRDRLLRARAALDGENE